MKNVIIPDVKTLASRQESGEDAGVVIVETVTISPESGLMSDYLSTIIKHGGLFDQAKAARVAGVSRSRIGQLVQAGRLPLVNVMLEIEGQSIPFEQLVPADALLAWMKGTRQTGRPRKLSSERPELQAA